MSMSTLKRSVVWLDQERERVKEVWRASTGSGGNGSPDAWIDLRSEPSSDDCDGETLSSFTLEEYTYRSMTASMITPPLLLEQAAGYDSGNGMPMYYERRVPFDVRSAGTKSSEESQTVYPDTLRLTGITISIGLTLFLVALDRTIVSTAMYPPCSTLLTRSPQITNDFHALEDGALYGSVYLLSTAALQLTWGKLFQIFNVKMTYMAVMCILMVGSLVCALAPNSHVFIFGRAIAGLGAGGNFAGGLVIIAHSVPLHRRAIYNGALGGIFGVSEPELRVLTMRSQRLWDRFLAAFLLSKSPGDGASGSTSPLR
jgi:Major Facilitator Superfamily